MTARQVREVVARLIDAGHWHDGDPAILVIFDAGYDVTRLAWLLADLPVELLGPAAQRPGDVAARAAAPGSAPWAPARHGGALTLADPATWPAPAVTTSTETTRYGIAAGRRLGPGAPAADHRAGWQDHDGKLPVIEGTLIRLQVDHLPGDRARNRVWLWSSRTGAAPADGGPCLAGVPAPFRSGDGQAAVLS